MPELRCPKCRIAMQTRDLAGTAVEVCARCAGFYLNEGELSRLRDTAGVKTALAAAPAVAAGAAPDETGPRMCPVCDHTMHAHPYLETGVTIDSCQVCGGVWLDEGEFAAVLARGEALAASGALDPELLAALDAQKRAGLEKSRRAALEGGEGPAGAIFRIFRGLLHRAGV